MACSCEPPIAGFGADISQALGAGAGAVFGALVGGPIAASALAVVGGEIARQVGTRVEDSYARGSINVTNPRAPSMDPIAGMIGDLASGIGAPAYATFSTYQVTPAPAPPMLHEVTQQGSGLYTRSQEYTPDPGPYGDAGTDTGDADSYKASPSSTWLWIFGGTAIAATLGVGTWIGINEYKHRKGRRRK